jgi:hypothetical protein
VTIPSRSQMAATDASVPPSRRSASWRTRTDIRRRSESTSSTSWKVQSGPVPTLSRKAASAVGPGVLSIEASGLGKDRRGNHENVRGALEPVRASRVMFVPAVGESVKDVRVDEDHEM